MEFPTHPLIEDVEEVYALPKGAIFRTEVNGGMLCSARGESKEEILAEAEARKAEGRTVYTVADLMPVRLVYHPAQYGDVPDDEEFGGMTEEDWEL